MIDIIERNIQNEAASLALRLYNLDKEKEDLEKRLQELYIASGTLKAVRDEEVKQHKSQAQGPAKGP